jgi:hypothetical protein
MLGVFAMSDPNPGKTHSGSAIFAILVLIAIAVGAGLKLPALGAFVVVLAALSLIMFVLGRAIVHQPLGILINEQNVMSLARLQMAVWTLAILGAYFTFALVRMKAGSPADQNPLDVAIDWHLLALMGISTTSFAGASLIGAAKQDKEPDDGVVEKTAGDSGETKDAVDSNRQGILYANGSKSDALLTDLFQGDELGNATHLDLGKVQMFYFTVIAVVVFLIMAAKSLHGGDLSKLPVLPDGLVAILGISHAGYLAGKGVDHTPLQ